MTGWLEPNHATMSTRGKKGDDEERHERENRARERSGRNNAAKRYGRKNVAGRKKSERDVIRRGWSGRVKARGGGRGRKPPLRTCGRPFSILINANNELFSVWLGADPPRRTAPRATTTWSRVQLYKRDRFQPPSNPRPAISYGLSHSLWPRNNQRRQPIAATACALATPPIANHRPRLTLMKASRGIDFDGALVPLFFSYIALFRCPGFPQSPRSVPPRPAAIPPLSFSLFHSVTNSRN